MGIGGCEVLERMKASVFGHEEWWSACRAGPRTGHDPPAAEQVVISR
jgi:hypothetical protein